MALTYTTLQTRILNLVERADTATTTEIPYHIEMAEADMSRRLHGRQRTIVAEASIADARSAVPDDFAGVISFKLEGGNHLVRITPDEMAEKKNDNTLTGEPTHYTVIGGEFEYYPNPDTTYTAELTYRQGIPALSSSVTSNWVLAKHPDAYLYGAAVHTAVYLQDGDRAAAFRALFEQAVDQIGRDAEQQIFGGRRALRRAPFPSC